MKKIIKKLIISLCGIIIGILISEIILKKGLEIIEKKRYKEFEKKYKELKREKKYSEGSPFERPKAYWDPYIGYRYIPSQRLLNRTINKYGFNNKEWSLKKEGDIIRIIIMGGSVAEGRADSETISSYLEKELKKEGKNVEVLNCGISGMMSTQERILFINEIIDFEPDIVIFLDGINELIPLKYGLKPGVYFYWLIGQYGISGGQPFSVIIKNFFKRLKLKLIEKSLVIKLIANLLKIELSIKQKEIKMDDIKKAIDIYKKNIEIIQLVGNHKKIKVLFFIQPLLITKKNLSIEEKYILEKMAPEEINLYKSGYKLYEELAKENEIILLTNIFDEIPEKIYQDICHLIPYGNYIVAKNMSKEILKIIK